MIVFLEDIIVIFSFEVHIKLLDGATLLSSVFIVSLHVLFALAELPAIDELAVEILSVNPVLRPYAVAMGYVILPLPVVENKFALAQNSVRSFLFAPHKRSRVSCAIRENAGSLAIPDSVWIFLSLVDAIRVFLFAHRVDDVSLLVNLEATSVSVKVVDVWSGSTVHRFHIQVVVVSHNLGLGHRLPEVLHGLLKLLVVNLILWLHKRLLQLLLLMPGLLLLILLKLHLFNFNFILKIWNK